jgi:hypothetical protein
LGKISQGIFMTTHELAKALLKEPNVKVVLSRDAEGNGYSPCSSICNAKYVPSSTCRGEIIPEDDDAEYKNAENVVVLWPNG